MLLRARLLRGVKHSACLSPALVVAAAHRLAHGSAVGFDSAPKQSDGSRSLLVRAKSVPLKCSLARRHLKPPSYLAPNPR